MSDVMNLLSLDNPVFGALALYTSLVALKMMALAMWIGMVRTKGKITANEEDLKIMCIGLSKSEKEKIKPGTDEKVERLRRIHLNDLENIPVFMIVAVFYVLTGPDPCLATWLFRAFFLCRLGHTTCYALGLVQPSRSVFFAVGYFITVAMAVQIILATLQYR